MHDRLPAEDEQVRPQAPPTLDELRRHLRRRLTVFLPAEEAQAETDRWLLEGLGIDRIRMATRRDELVDELALPRVEAWLERREQGEPWSYILGRAFFRDRSFEVNADVLIPRPETELLLEAALDVGKRLGVLHVTDVGTGSGILAVCLALETDWQVRAVDLSRKALRVAKRNAEALGAKIAFLEGSLLGPVPDPVGLVVSNPPYVDPADRPSLQRELGFEPEMALFAEDRGLALSTELLRQGRVRSAPGVLLEIGSGQGQELSDRARAMGWKRVHVHRDLAGHDRVLIAI